MITGALVIMEFHAFLHFNLRDGPGISSDTEKFHKIKYVARSTWDIQLSGVDYLFHREGARVCVKLEN